MFTYKISRTYTSLLFWENVVWHISSKMRSSCGNRASAKETFHSPWECGIGLRGFLIKSDARRGVSNGNMHVRPRDFAGGVRPAPFVKRGCDSITMEFIHPFIHPAARRWVHYGAERATKRKFFFFLHFLPLPWACIVIKKTWSELAIRFRARFLPGRELSGENFPRKYRCTAPIHPHKYLL